jgi:hypothetical protein
MVYHRCSIRYAARYQVAVDRTSGDLHYASEIPPFERTFVAAPHLCYRHPPDSVTLRGAAQLQLVSVLKAPANELS